MTLGDQYIRQCRNNTLQGITPANTEKYHSVEYEALISIGKKYIQEVGLSEFSNYFQGEHYFIELWTAHIIFEHGNPDPVLRKQCIDIIKQYSNNPLSPNVSDEESKWLKKNNL